MIIIGNGFIAKNLKKIKLKNKKTIFFASGVSNSNCKSALEFNREYRKLKAIKKNYSSYRFIYFSSCSVTDKSRKNNDYQKHKLRIERYIKNNIKNYKIFRIPEVIGNNKNSNTLLNFFFNSFKNNKKIQTSHNAYRNLIDIKKIILTVEFILNNNYKKRTIDIVNLNYYSTIEIISCFEKIFKKKIKYITNTKYDNIDKYKVDFNFIEKIYNKMDIKFKKNYLCMELKKIYNQLI
jgi:UDP-2-acetamido-2,6-beta-L-arabino-hexul-4-ose reductase